MAVDADEDGRIRFERGVRWGACPEQIFEDARLRHSARVVAAWLCIRPPAWSIKIEHMRSRLGLGKDGWKAAKRDLTASGYLRGERIRGANGRLAGWDYTFNPLPPPAPSNGFSTGGKSHRWSEPLVEDPDPSINSVGINNRKTTTTPPAGAGALVAGAGGGLDVEGTQTTRPAQAGQAGLLVDEVVKMMPGVGQAAIGRVIRNMKGATLEQQQIAVQSLRKKLAGGEAVGVGYIVNLAKLAVAGELVASASVPQPVAAQVAAPAASRAEDPGLVAAAIAARCQARPGATISGQGLSGEAVVVDSAGGLCQDRATGPRYALATAARIWRAVEEGKLTLTQARGET